MSNEDGQIRVTFNGEIYNFRELRRWLETKGHRFRSNTDTEVLVHLYEERGQEMVHDLDGDFAFGLWDSRHERLLVARDRAGVKPLYYTVVDGVFLFGSEIKAILQHPSVQREVDEEALYHYLTYLVSPAPRTLFEGIQKVPAGGLIVVEPARPQSHYSASKYWRPYPSEAPREQDRDQELEVLFERAVSKRLMSDVPVGVLFSGGVDSTLNTVFFKRAAAPALVHTFTVGMDGTGLFRDEREIALRRSKELGTTHHEITISVSDLIETAQDLPRYQDEPISDPVSVPLYFVMKLAKSEGISVLHAGEGADEVFCGYDNYRRFLRHNRQFWQPLRLVPPSLRSLGFQVLRRSSFPRHRKMADALRRSAAGQEFFMASAVAYYEDEKQLILSPEFRHACQDMDSFDVVAPLYDDFQRERPNATFLEAMTFIELQMRLPELLLMRVDKMSMAHAVEVRVPFLDRDLVRFGLSVPEQYKLRDGVSKEPIKRLASRFTSRTNVYEQKRGFGAPIQDWLRGDLGKHMLEIVEQDAPDVERFFSVRELRRRLARGPRTVNEAFQLWVVYNFLNWRRSYFGERVSLAA